MVPKTLNSEAISMGIAPNDARLWRGSTDTGIMGNEEEKFGSKRGCDHESVSLIM